MLDQRRVAAQTDENCDHAFREQIFIERYANLRVWAMYLTHHESTADDLVHDLYVQWMLSRTRLEEIENLDGYLRTMLRNMHFSRLSRAAQRLQETTLSIADYDSGQLGWTAIEPPRRMQAAEELHQICAYACFRKESSKAGSVLILRFFHNYFPSEIASVLNTSRNCVDQWQRHARREAKSFLNRPSGLRFVNGEAPARPAVRYLRSDCDLMFDLRQLIFSSCRGECLRQHELNEAYAGGHDETLTTTKLAHLVSCPKCLDAVNVLLSLPLLAERDRSESIEPKDPPSDANGGSGNGAAELRRKLARRLRETQEHKPHELRIAVNGLLVSSMKVSAEISELDLNLATEDRIDFVEICSEQGVQLLFFSISSNGPHHDQWAWIELSEGRLLEATYHDVNGPSLRVVYRDPAAAEAHSLTEIPETHALSSPLTAVLAEPDVGAQRDVRGWVNRLISTLRISRNTAENITERDNAGAVLFKSLNEASDRRSPRRLALITLACIAAAAGLLYFKASLSRELNATALLERAVRAEQVARQTPDRISHRFINLEERRSAEGAVVARRRIEVWQHHDGNSARRLYDDSNQLIAGAWQKADGSRTVFHHGAKPRSETALATPGDLLLNLEDAWQLELSAQSFAALINDTVGIEIEERSTTYVLTYAKQRIIGASLVLKATLTLSKSDFHAIEQTLLVQRGNEIREYRFVEASSELLPLRAVSPSVFEIEPELNGGAAEPGRPGDWAHRNLTSGRVPSSPSASAPPSASVELEVDVAYLLNRAKADRNEQVTLTRSAGGSLRVEGIVDTEARKQEFVNALAPVSNNPAVKIEIRTIADALKRPIVLSPVTVQEETANAIAVDDELRAYFEKRTSAGPTDEAIRNYSSRLVKRAYDAMFHAIELKRLVNRFANVDMQTVAPDARAKWLRMLHEQAAAFEHDTSSLRLEIQPVFFPRAPVPFAEGGSIGSDADLARAVERLHKLALTNNDAVRSAFTTSSQSSAAAVKSAAFWQALFKAEGLAKKIQQYQSE